jgi:glycosyltransferase involved in cell wall biosynthesis
MKHNVVACIPTRNTAWLLQHTLKHLSTFCEKIIISDDCSTDNTREICTSYDKVEYFKRPPRAYGDRQGALQRQELLTAAYRHDPDYFFFLDADEMPSPNIVGWINSLDRRQEELVNLWTFPWVHLWRDKYHYRVDSYRAKNGANIHWDPFTTTYRKGFFVRNIPNYNFEYDIKQHRVRPSNQPINVPKPWTDVVDSPVIVHYGKISDYFISGQNWKDRAIWDNYEKNTDLNRTLIHHEISNAEDTLELKKVKRGWFWE